MKVNRIDSPDERNEEYGYRGITVKELRDFLSTIDDDANEWRNKKDSYEKFVNDHKTADGQYRFNDQKIKNDHINRCVYELLKCLMNTCPKSRYLSNAIENLRNFKIMAHGAIFKEIEDIILEKEKDKE